MDFLSGLNPQQQEAVQHVEGPMLLLAGAGSGKTRVITHRMAHLMAAAHVPGSCILAVTFTNKAAAEMRERVRKLVGITSGGLPNVSTFHSFCVRLLRKDGAPLGEVRAGFTPTFTIYDADDQVSLLRGIYRGLGLDEKFLAYRAALSRISQAKSKNDSPSDLAKEAKDPISTRLAVIYDRYEDALRKANALDFDDLLLETVRLLRHSAEKRALLNRRYEFLMVDEYQDTNHTQYELMQLLSEERSNLVVVGDEDQSIYGWRGADIRNILDFERDYPKARVIRLEQNYRSTKNILDAASSVVANNKERKGKWLWTDSGDGEKIALYEAMDGENEALWIADTIEKRLSVNPAERVAVLYRTNFQSRQIEEALRRYGRKYLVVGGFSFYQRAEIKDILSYLKALYSPQDSIAMQRVINTPARGIGKTTVDQIEQFGRDHSIAFWNAIEGVLDQHELGGRAEAAVAAFYRMMKELRDDLDRKPVHELLEAVVERTGYRRMLESEQGPDAESRIQNIEELLNAAAEAAERGETVADFLDHAALVADADSVDERAQVSLLTVHNAKG
ncbi:MAG: UvrD-helicase domain-containing protein, partial [Bryobacteraceae bacterium]